MESIWITSVHGVLCKHTVLHSGAEALACQFHGKCKYKFALMVAIPLKHEIPGQSKVIPGSLDTPSKSVKSLDCPGHPWRVGNYASISEYPLHDLFTILTESELDWASRVCSIVVYVSCGISIAKGM